MGREPKDIRAHLIDDLLVVRLKGVLTAAEQHLVKTLQPEKGTRNVQMLRPISQKLGIQSAITDDEITEMTKPTSVPAFVGEIEKSRDSGLAANETVVGIEKDLAEERRLKNGKS